MPLIFVVHTYELCSLYPALQISALCLLKTEESMKEMVMIVAGGAAS
jgi:hypothetical protein